MRDKTPQFDSNERSEPTSTPDTPVFNLSDFEDYVAFHRKCDLIEHGSKSSPIKMSQKKCRFCD